MSARNLVGVDTLKLRLSDYEISPCPSLTLRRPDLDAATGEESASYPLWRDGAGGWVYGARAFHNAETVKVSLGRLGSGAEEESCEPLGVGCWVEFSVPKRAGVGSGGAASNFRAVGKAATGEALKGVELELREIGIKTNIHAAAISRLDVFRNVQCEEPFECYAPIFRLLELTRMPKRDYGTTFLFNNTQQETCIYDKVAELAKRAAIARKPFDAKAFPANTFRFENRMLKPRKVRDVLGFGTARELGKNFGDVGAAFRSTMEKQFFGRTLQDFEAVCVRDLEQDLTDYKRRFGGGSKSRWLDKYLRAVGVCYLAENYGPDAVKRAFLEVADTEGETLKKQRQRLQKQLNEALFEAQMLRVHTPSKRKLGELYAELQEKVLAP